MRSAVALLILTVAFAGCTDDPAVDMDALGDEATDSMVAPLGNLTLDLLNGTAPLLVNITIDAMGNATEWMLDLGDGNVTNGTTFPALVNHTFFAGNFSINLTVAGPGGNHSLMQNLTVAEQIVEDVEEIAAPIELMPFSETVSLDLPCVACGDGGTATCTWRQTGGATPPDCAWIDFPDDLAGQPFTLTGNGLDQDVLFWSECNSGVLDKFNGLNDGESGIVPAGAGCALVWEQFDFLIEVTFSITPV